MPPTIYQFIVGGAMLANAVVGHMLYRAAFSDAGHQPIIAATALAVGVGMLLGLGVIGLLAIVAANFENGLSRGGLGSAVALMVGLFVVQLAILSGSARIEGRDLGASAASIARGAVQFWLLVLGVSFGAKMLEGLLP